MWWSTTRGSIRAGDNRSEPRGLEKVIETNLTGPFLVMKASIPHLIKGAEALSSMFLRWADYAAFRGCRRIARQKPA